MAEQSSGNVKCFACGKEAAGSLASPPVNTNTGKPWGVRYPRKDKSPGAARWGCSDECLGRIDNAATAENKGGAAAKPASAPAPAKGAEKPQEAAGDNAPAGKGEGQGEGQEDAPEGKPAKVGKTKPAK